MNFFFWYIAAERRLVFFQAPDFLHWHWNSDAFCIVIQVTFRTRIYHCNVNSQVRCFAVRFCKDRFVSFSLRRLTYLVMKAQSRVHWSRLQSWKLWKVWTQESWIWLLLTVTDVSTTCAVVIFRFKVSCITSVDAIKLWLLMWSKLESTRNTKGGGTSPSSILTCQSLFGSLQLSVSFKVQDGGRTLISSFALQNALTSQASIRHPCHFHLE